MNLISNNCLSGHLYRLFLKTEYKNPFIWTVIDFNSMKNLVEHWNTINFDNYELKKDKYWNFYLVIDNIVKIQYVHCKFDPTAKIIKKNKSFTGEVFYNKIWKYIIDIYDRRLKRMTETPIFCIMNFNTIYKDAIYTDEELNYLSKYNNVKILKGYEKTNPIKAAEIFYNKVLK